MGDRRIVCITKHLHATLYIRLIPKRKHLKQASPLMMDGYEPIVREKEAGRGCFHLGVGIPNLNPFLDTISQYPARLIGRL
jgi:hypothetical protein